MLSSSKVQLRGGCFPDGKEDDGESYLVEGQLSNLGENDRRDESNPFPVAKQSQPVEDRALKGAQGAVILCNAQPFGFGPAASLSAVLPYLRSAFAGQNVQLHYVGSRHTLALHTLCKDAEDTHGWDAVHDIDVYREGGLQTLLELCATLKPALFLTISDGTAATTVLDTGIPVVVVDLLLWFWIKIPAPWFRAYRVLVTDFYGVKERIARDSLTNVVAVPAIAPPVATDVAPRAGVLVNMGGLRHPYIAADEHVRYAQIIDTAARTALRQCKDASGSDMPLQVLASPEIVSSLGHSRAKTAQPEEVQTLLRASQLVCITPGLGNLFEAAACAHGIFILPPINTSQGLQMVTLQREGLLPCYADWHNIVECTPIDYRKPMQEAEPEILAAQQKLVESPTAQARLVKYIVDAIMGSTLSSKTSQVPPLRAIITKYGNDGARVIADTIVATFNEAGRNRDCIQETTCVLADTSFATFQWE